MTTTQTTTAASSTSDTITRYFAAIRAMDREAWLDCFAEDARSEDPVGAPPHVGRAALGAFFDAIAGSVRSIGIVEDAQYMCGSSAAVRWIGWCVSKRGEHLRFEGIDVFHFDARGRIRSLEAYWDAAGLLERLA